ncbi:cation-transporting P-type ATPase [Streptomyces sp. NPDC002463]|uniref:cation-transporting P-type ATPase n=1 Tax=Streptomyces sp. NPDC002463 TaxID=3364645 RepID=UPI003677FFF4
MTASVTAPAGEAAGLTEKEAARRLAETGPNETATRKSVRLHSRVLAQLGDPLIMVLLGAVALTLAIGDHPDAIVIALVVVVNTTVGVAQEIRADDAVAALSAMSAPHARVRRDGAVRDLPAAEVVPGDVLVLGGAWQRLLLLAAVVTSVTLGAGLAAEALGSPGRACSSSPCSPRSSVSSWDCAPAW